MAIKAANGPEIEVALRRARTALTDAAALRDAAGAHVANARRLGASWADVGLALGVTRQSAHERFRRWERGRR